MSTISKPGPAVIVLGVLFAIALLSFMAVALAFDGYKIPSEAMKPTLEPGDRVLGAAWSTSDAKRGDIVIYRLPGIDEGSFISRVVAVGGTRVDEPGVDAQVVPKGSVFLMGDNRTNSRDSRFFGPVPTSNVVSRVVLRFSLDTYLALAAAAFGLATVIVAVLLGAQRLPREENVTFRDLGRREDRDDLWGG